MCVCVCVCKSLMPFAPHHWRFHLAWSPRPTKEPPSHARAPTPSHKTTPRCLPLHTTRVLTPTVGQ